MKEKIKNKMSMKKKVFISILLIVLSFILGSTIYTFVAPPVYLAVKYDTSPFNYKLDRYDPAIYVFDLNNFDDYFTTPTWQYTYNDKELMVQFFDNSFYDDYQMEYLFNESVKQLKKNVDNRIDGFAVNCDNSYGINDDEEGKLKNTFWNENNIDVFINNNLTANIYVKVDEISQFYDNDGYSDKYYELTNSIEKKFRKTYPNVTIVQIFIHKGTVEYSRDTANSYDFTSCYDANLDTESKWYKENFVNYIY